MSKKKFDQVIKKFLLNELTTVPQNLEQDLEKVLKSLPTQDKNTLVTVGDAQANAASSDPNDQTHGLLSQLIHPTDGPKTYDQLVAKNPQAKSALEKRIKDLGLTSITTAKTQTPTQDTSKTPTPYKSAQASTSTDTAVDHPGVI